MVPVIPRELALMLKPVSGPPTRISPVRVTSDKVPRASSASPVLNRAFPPCPLITPPLTELPGARKVPLGVTSITPSELSNVRFVTKISPNSGTIIPRLLN